MLEADETLLELRELCERLGISRKQTTGGRNVLSKVAQNR
jgi:hypothetical protein